jgi:7-cyano-7-deazaguanine reductase
MTDTSSLSQLGRQVDAPASPEEAVLEKVPNGNQVTDYVVRFTAPEFTSLCPMTGQPDFAHIVIDYIPRCASRGIEVAEALPALVPQSRRLP